MRTAHELLPPGVIALERGWLSSNNVVLMGQEQVAVIDSGYWIHAAQTVDLVLHATGGRAPSVLVNTHLHSDHCGGNALLQESFPALRTLIPPGLAGAVREWDPVALTYEPTGQNCPRFRFEGVATPGDTLRLGRYAWEVHGAPGHDPHSIVLFEPESRTLISADALWERGFGVVFQELEGEDAFGEVESTLDLIEKLAPRVVIPGHGSVFTDVAGALDVAHRRLKAYRADPVRHASHAAKVLIKFRLLEWQEVDWDAFLDWAEGTAYLRIVRDLYFPGRALRAWAQQLVEELLGSGAAARDGNLLVNR